MPYLKAVTTGRYNDKLSFRAIVRSVNTSTGRPHSRSVVYQSPGLFEETAPWQTSRRRANVLARQSN